MQILHHYNIFQTKPEILLEKLHLLATAQVDGKYKQWWLKWWNMSKDGRQAYNFPDSLCSTLSLRPWVEIAAFWAGVGIFEFSTVLVVFLIREIFCDEICCPPNLLVIYKFSEEVILALNDAVIFCISDLRYNVL